MRQSHRWRETLSLLREGCKAYIPIIETTPEPSKVADVRQPSGKGIIMNVARSFNNWMKFRQTVTELGRMSRRELQDLGIDRADIRRVAKASIAV